MTLGKKMRGGEKYIDSHKSDFGKLSWINKHKMLEELMS